MLNLGISCSTILLMLYDMSSIQYFHMNLRASTNAHTNAQQIQLHKLTVILNSHTSNCFLNQTVKSKSMNRLLKNLLELSIYMKFFTVIGSISCMVSIQMTRFIQVDTAQDIECYFLNSTNFLADIQKIILNRWFISVQAENPDETRFFHGV